MRGLRRDTDFQRHVDAKESGARCAASQLRAAHSSVPRPHRVPSATRAPRWGLQRVALPRRQPARPSLAPLEQPMGFRICARSVGRHCIVTPALLGTNNRRWRAAGGGLMKATSFRSAFAMLLDAAPRRIVNGSPLRVISDGELLPHVSSGALRRLTVVQTDDDMYRLHVRLTLEPDDFILASVNGRPAEWSSLDTLAKTIRERYGSPECIAVSLKKPADRLATTGEKEPDLTGMSAAKRALPRSLPRVFPAGAAR